MQLVSPHNGALGQPALDPLIAINKHKVRLNTLNREFHRQAGCLQDVYPVYSARPDGDD
jgi:hypothetical protein